MTTEMLTLKGESLGKLILLVIEGKVGRANAKKILADMFDDNSIAPEEYAKEKGYIISSDTGAIEAVVNAVVASDPATVQDYKNGREKALMALFGRCMKGFCAESAEELQFCCFVPVPCSVRCSWTSCFWDTIRIGCSRSWA